jgi:large subunit ribosomal protein L3
MKAALLGTKIGMTRVIGPAGDVTPVIVVRAGPCTVLQVKTKAVDGYDAVQLGFEDVKPHRSTKPLIGHAGGAGTGPKRYAREVRLEGEADVAPGAVLTVSVFAEGSIGWVDVTGTTKGRGFTGVMRRWGFGGQPASHGTERKHRSPGSIGGMGSRGHGRCIKKGRHMAGRYGFERVTQRCLRLVAVDQENNLLLVKGSVPGPNGSLLFVRQCKTKA